MSSQRIIRVDSQACGALALRPAIDWLRQGGIVAFPTDTLYGLAVDPRSAAAVGALFDLKGRAPAAALPFIAADRAQVEDYCGVLPSTAARLADRFWPGPLSLILDAPRGIVAAVLGGGDSIAIRVPAAVVARRLAEAWGAPLPATSANRSGEAPAATTAAFEAIASDPRVLVIDGGSTPGGEPSTIVDARAPAPVLVRAGAVPWERVLRSLDT